jgi:superfamily II RNA helicase
VDDPEAGRVLHWHGYHLNLFQQKAVAGIRSGANILVSAPTGAGKTLVAEYAMEDAVRRGRRCVYTAPIKALSNQKYRDFRDVPEIDAGIMTGDVTIHAGAQVLIMTTEILRNAIFESPQLLHDVEYVIFDEIHYLDDRERGSVWEESLIFLPPEVRLICLSATISNVEEIGSWLREIRPQELEVIRSDERPVPLSHWIHTRAHGTFDIGKLKSVLRRRRGKGPDPAPDRGDRGRRRGGRGRRGRSYEEPPDPSRLFDELQAEDRLPALVFSFSRRDVERLARQSSSRQLLNEAEGERMRLLQLELVRLFQLEEGELVGDVMRMARHGVSYHHAGMLPVHKELVERMFTAGLLKLLFTTETFALGINMPARSVVFQALRKFDGVDFDWLRTRDYMQMAGRAGRQGIDDVGYVYSLVRDGELAEAPLARLASGRPEPVVSRLRLSYSTLLHLVELLGRERVHDAWEKSFHEYQGRAKNAKARERHRRGQRREIEARLTLLEELGYLAGDELTDRGRIARLVTGYELQVTELLFSGTLENLPPQALAIVFVGLIHEDRRRFERPWVSAKMFGDLRAEVTRVIHQVGGREARLGIEPPIKQPDWGLTPSVIAWYEGARFEELDGLNDVTPGDLVRSLRMAKQLLRNVRRAIDSDWDLAESLREAATAIDRDEVDARRQLELG